MATAKLKSKPKVKKDKPVKDDASYVKNYKFGVPFWAKVELPAELVSTVVAQGHEYYNTLVKIENDRRAANTKFMRERFKDYDDVMKERDAANERCEAVYTAIKDHKRTNRTSKIPQELIDQLDVVKAERKLINDREKEVRKARWKLGIMKKFADSSQKIANEASRLARNAAAAAGFWWGHYQRVEEAVKAAKNKKKGGPLRTKHPLERYEGALSCHPGNGAVVFTVEQAVAGNSTIKIEKGDRPKLYWCTFPVGGGEGTRKQVTIRVPFYYHRELPPQSRILWIKLFKRKYGACFKYNLQFTIKYREHTPLVHRQDATVGMNFGWRLRPEGVRVALWLGSDGQHDELVIPHEQLRAYLYTRELQEIRQKRFNIMRDSMVAFMKNYPDLPESHKERFKTLAFWCSTEGLRQACYWWSENRLPGDEELHAAMHDGRESYCRKELHLSQWQTAIREKFENWRLYTYREFACKMFGLYGNLRISNTDWSKLQRTSLLGKPADYAKEYKNAAAVSVLENALVLKFGKAFTKEFPASLKTQTCHVCKHKHEDEVGETLTWQCTNCHREWDIDFNHAHNILNAVDKKGRGRDRSK